MEIKAKLLEKFDTVNVSDTFRKREFVVEYAENPQYPEYIKFELIQERCDQLDQYNIDQEINISFNLRGRKWTNPEGKVIYFNSLQAWKLDAVNNVAPNPQQPPQAAPTAQATPSQAPAENAAQSDWLAAENKEEDDLPF